MPKTRINVAVPLSLLVALCTVMAGFLVLDRSFRIDRQRDISLTRAHLWLRSLAIVLESDDSETPAPTKVSALANAMRRNDAGIRELQILSGTTFVYHSDPRKLGRELNPDDADDKSIYDSGVEIRYLLKSARRKPYLLDLDRAAGVLTLSEPVLKSARKSKGTVRLTYGLEKTWSSLDWRIPLFFLAMFLACSFSSSKWPRWRWPLAGVCLLAALAVGSLLLLANDRQNSQWVREAKLGHLARVGTVLAREDLDLLAGFVGDLKGGPFGAMLGEWKTVRLLAPGEAAGRDEADVLMLGSPGRIACATDETAVKNAEQESVRKLKIILAVFLLLAVLLLFFIMAGHALRTMRALGKYHYSYIMIFPAMVGLIALVLLPFMYGLSMGFFRVQPGQSGNWVFVGLQNFIEILSDVHPLTPGNFYFTLLVTVMWTVINVFLHVCIGLALAIILIRPDFAFKRVYRVLLILPWAMPNYITALIWKGMFHKQFGAINAFIKLLGFEPISFFNNFWTAFFANVTTNTWLGFPFMMVICLGALQSIPADLYEAAQIDGAGKWQQFKKITLPLLKPALFPAVILGTIWTFNMFNIIYLVSNGEPNRSTDILITQAYRFAFEKFNWGYAAAYSILIFLILLTYGIFTNRITKATEGVFD